MLKGTWLDETLFILLQGDLDKAWQFVLSYQIPSLPQGRATLKVCRVGEEHWLTPGGGICMSCPICHFFCHCRDVAKGEGTMGHCSVWAHQWIHPWQCLPFLFSFKMECTRTITPMLWTWKQRHRNQMQRWAPNTGLPQSQALTTYLPFMILPTTSEGGYESALSEEL